MSTLPVIVLLSAAAIILAAAVLTALVRIIRGPSILDRMIGTDVVLASLMCGLGGYMALVGRTDLLPVLIVLAMLGFVGSVSVSRYVSKSDSMTPGAEAGALSDFSAADWHMSLDAAPEAPDAVDAGTEDGEADAGHDDVARGIALVADGPDSITVNAEEASPESAEGPTEEGDGHVR